MRIFRERGVADLFRLLREEPQLLRGAFIADKVVAKARGARWCWAEWRGFSPTW